MKRALSLYVLIIIISTFQGMAQHNEPDTLVSLDAVEIVDTQKSESAFTVHSLNRQKIESMPAKDVGGIMRSIPNVSGIRKGGAVSDPVVRGFKYSQLNVQLNGGQKIEGGCPNRMDPAAAHIDVDDINSLEVIKGPFALKYGPNFGGVINMKTLQPLPNNEFEINVGAMIGYESNWNGMKNRLSVNGGNDKVFFFLSGNFKKYGNYKDGDGREVKSGFEKCNYTAQIGLRPFINNYLVIAYDQSHGKNVLFPSLPMDEREDNTRLISLDYKAMEISEHFSLFSAKLYLSDVSHLMDNKERPFSDTVVAVSDIQARNYGFRMDGRFDFGKSEITVGTDYEHILKDGTRTKTKILEPTMPEMSEKLWNDAAIQNNGLFVLFRRGFGDFVLDAAVRLDYNRANSSQLQLVKMGNEVYLNTDVESSYTNYSASVGIQYPVNEKISIGMSVGRGVRSPDMSERFILLLPIGFDNYDYLGNPQLKPEANNEVDMSAKLDFPEAGTLEGGFFFSYVTGFISGELVPESVVKPQTKGVLGVKQFYNVDHAFLNGFEITYQSSETNNLGFRARAACTRGVNPEATEYIIEDGEVTGTETIKNDPLPEIPPLEGAVDVFYRFFDGRLVPDVNIRMVAAQKKVSESYMENETPGFMLLNFNFLYQHSANLKFSGGVSNIFDKLYYEHLNRRIIGGKGELYEAGRVFYLNVYFNL
ncbi:MAG: TonB-dependent receptor [Bacteroidota bacterium]